jgi:GT2 family glycosyltransferase
LDPAPYEIITVMDGCTDHSYENAIGQGVCVLNLDEKCGPATARNLGARAAKGDIVFFIDADTEVPKDVIGRIRQAFHGDPKISAVIGSYDDEPDASNFLSQYKNLFHHFIHQQSAEDASTFWGACGAIKRDVFIETGGFNERYREPSVEDIEYGYRLKQNGYGIRLIKSLQVKHLKKWTMASLLKTDLIHRAIPWTKLILVHRVMPNDLNLTHGNRLGSVLVFMCLALIPGVIQNQRFLIPILIFFSILLWVNRHLYMFFKRKKGLGFALCAIPWHWFYHLYCGIGFGVGCFQYLIGKRDI